MKKIVILVLPILITIALVFALQGGRNFDTVGFLNLLSTWRFDNFFEALNNATSAFSEVGNNFRSIGNSANPLEVVSKIFTGLYNLIIGLGYMISSITQVAIDIIQNVGRIVGWLFAR